MRRSLSGLVLGLALLVGSLSWASFVLTQTVLNPDRSEQLSDQLVDNDGVRSAIVGRLATSLGEILPVDAPPVPRQALDSAASDAIEEPGISAELQRAIVQVHQNALFGVEENVTLDASVLGIAARNQLVGDRQELEGQIPEAPELAIELPTAGLAFLGTIRSGVETFALLSAIGAGVAALAALILAKNRPAVLRRVAFWAFGTSLFWLALGFGVPFAARLLAPASGALIAGIVEVFFGAMIPPAVVMAVAGAALLLISAIWPNAARRRPAKAIHARPIDAPPVQVVAPQQAASTPTGSNVRDYGAQLTKPANAAPPSHRAVRPQASPQPGQTTSDRTTVMPTAAPGPAHAGSAHTGPAQDSPFANPSYEPPSDIWKSPANAEPTTQADQSAKAATATEVPPEWKPGVGYLDPD